MTKIYDHWKPAMGAFVGHMDADGIVYNHWSCEGIDDSVGHVDRDGVVYNHWSREGIGDSVGHVGKDGVIYNHWSRETSSEAVGHVGKDGIVYNHWCREGIGESVGRVEGRNTYAAGAAYLLLNDSFRKKQVTIDTPDPPYDDEEARRRREEEQRIRREKYQRYLSNPKIVAEAEKYARQRASAATKFAPLFILLVCIGGFKGMAKEAFLPVVAILALFILVMTIFARRMTNQEAFKQKVWELGEAGFGAESVCESCQKHEETTGMDTPAPDPDPILAGHRIVACPHCGAKCKVPVGLGTIQITCPNANCSVETFIIDT